ncbi:ribitol kinase [Verticillium alfalfae VaMs.102]|uniref:Ribitol kinase n=1 Tax=Verticillium alfalfae (strain VaMs.102 / ATCC MYA-4576 / FGSC 10136) TaxID=526221 RepID=C9SQ93_VERA1|nr:ribitol kinase [Verticillium alfalfae VaMs.102]EEY21018.1 ribitol kinase [Verticillium alfalfae VaMs.102]
MASLNAPRPTLESRGSYWERPGAQARHDTNNHFIGIDVGTGSARACIIDETGDIKSLASETIKLWQPQTGYYRVVEESGVDVSKIKGIGFDATCSLAVFSHDTDEPIAVTGPSFDNADGADRNVVLWLDHRPGWAKYSERLGEAWSDTSAKKGPRKQLRLP